MVNIFYLNIYGTSEADHRPLQRERWSFLWQKLMPKIVNYCHKESNLRCFRGPRPISVYIIQNIL